MHEISELARGRISELARVRQTKEAISGCRQICEEAGCVKNPQVSAKDLQQYLDSD